MRAIRALCTTLLLCALSALAIATTGCSSMHRVPLLTAAGQPSSLGVRPGDTVEVTSRDGRRARFTVRTVDTAAIIAEDGTRYELTDILSVERRGFSGLRTTFLVVGIWAVVAVIEVAGASAGFIGY